MATRLHFSEQRANDYYPANNNNVTPNAGSALT